MTEAWQLSRRNFIKAAGLGIAAVSTSMPNPARVLASSGSVHKIGVLLPTSKIYPDMSDQFQVGLELGLKSFPLKSLSLDTIGFSSDSVLQKIPLMAEKENVDVIVGLVNPRTTPMISTALEEHGIFFVASNLGENIVRSNERSPFVLHTSMNYWQSNWALGTWAAQNMGSRAVMASSSYDSGYDAFAAFRLAFEAAGGHVEQFYISDGALRQDLDAILQESQPDFVYAAFCGQAGTAFLKQYAGKVPVLGSSFLLSTAPDAPQRGVKVASLPMPDPELFAPLYAVDTAPDPFKALGFQAALKVLNLAQKQGNLFKPTYQSNPIYLYSDDSVEELPSVNIPSALAALEHFGMQSGWINPYLCV